LRRAGIRRARLAERNLPVLDLTIATRPGKAAPVAPTYSNAEAQPQAK